MMRTPLSCVYTEQKTVEDRCRSISFQAGFLGGDLGFVEPANTKESVFLNTPSLVSLVGSVPPERYDSTPCLDLTLATPFFFF